MQIADFEAVLVQYRQKWLATIRAITRLGREDAEDLLQDCLLHVDYAKIDETKASARTYITRLLIWRSIDAKRRLRRPQLVQEGYDGQIDNTWFEAEENGES